MARKKTTESTAAANPVEESQDVVIQPAETQEAPALQIEKKEPTVKIPEWANKALKMYADMEFAYIDNQGGVFAATIPEGLRKGVVLYKNPYFKS